MKDNTKYYLYDCSIKKRESHVHFSCAVKRSIEMTLQNEQLNITSKISKKANIMQPISKTIYFVAANVAGIVSLVLVGVWMNKDIGGFDWKDKIFSYHAFFMTFGLIYLYGNGINTELA